MLARMKSSAANTHWPCRMKNIAATALAPKTRKAPSRRFFAAEWSAMAPRIGERTAMMVSPSVVARLNR
jgi:hypothetical protein